LPLPLIAAAGVFSSTVLLVLLLLLPPPLPPHPLNATTDVNITHMQIPAITFFFMALLHSIEFGMKRLSGFQSIETGRQASKIRANG
jgi:hypothetical protein